MKFRVGDRVRFIRHDDAPYGLEGEVIRGGGEDDSLIVWFGDSFTDGWLMDGKAGHWYCDVSELELADEAPPVPTEDAELAAINAVVSALKTLGTHVERKRVIDYAWARFTT